MWRSQRKIFPLVLGLILAATGYVGGLWHDRSGGLAVADDNGITFTPEQKRRAQQLFRNYCMDCHGPKLTGEKFDKTLLCPNVQGKGTDEYRKAVLEGPDIMPKFQVSPSYVSDGNLRLSYDDFVLLTNHEATFTSTQP